MVSTMQRAAAVGVSPNRITLLRDADGDGVAEIREVFLDGLNQPFGMALLGDTFYVGNTDGVVAFPYTAGATRITGPGRKLAAFKPGGHWTRSLLPSPDGRKLYVGVGSLSNIGDHGMEAEEGRAAIYELDLASGTSRIFACGLRNPVGLAWEPQTGALWTVVNERDGLGDETPPDYLTSVRDGGFYGWPYCYWGQTVDDRVPQDPAMVAKAMTPDYALGGHTASLGLCWLPAGTLPGFPRRHGDRAARLLEPQQAQRLQGHLRAVRERPPGRSAARHPVGLPRAGRAGVLRPAGRRDDRPRRLAAGGGRCGRRDLAGDGRGAGLTEMAAGAPSDAFAIGRSGRIRTCDPSVPNAVLYQTELHSDGVAVRIVGRRGRSKPALSRSTTRYVADAEHAAIAAVARHQSLPARIEIEEIVGAFHRFAAPPSA